MKARVFRIFRDINHKIKYTYVDVAKFHDDIKSVSHHIYYTPMMEIKLWKDEDTLEAEGMIVLATPEIVKEYTGFDMFNVDYSYSIHGKAIDIDFEWIECDYPYIKLWDTRDFITGCKVKIPQISRIKSSYQTFVDSLD